MENLSITPFIPKSGEQDDQIDPIATVPKKETLLFQRIFGIYAAILSLDLIFNFLKIGNILHFYLIASNFLFLDNHFH